MRFCYVPLPTLIPGLSTKNVVCMCSNCHFTACVTSDGEVHYTAWGANNDSGNLGHGDREDLYTPKRVDALNGVKATQVACGKYHTAVQLEGLKFYCMSALERGLFCRENVHQILQEDERNLSCPCDELKRMCRVYLKRLENYE